MPMPCKMAATWVARSKVGILYRADIEGDFLLHVGGTSREDARLTFDPASVRACCGSVFPQEVAELLLSRGIGQLRSDVAALSSSGIA